MINVDSQVMLNMSEINKLCEAQIQALEETGEALRTEVVQRQIMPFDKGNLQNESTFVDLTQSKNGKVSIVSSTPYARRLYFHPEFNFSKDENPNAKGEWYEDYVPGGKYDTFAQNKYKELYGRIAGL